MLPVLNTERLTIAHMSLPQAPLLVDFFRRNEQHLAPWDPPRPAAFYALDFWERECERAADEYAEGSVARWIMMLREDHSRIVGRINYTQIARGPFQSCMLGYALDAEYEGRGLMTEALQATNAHVFEILRLHRIQANHLPNNLRSSRLLARLGFQQEGLAKNYLFVAGAWRDHVLTALINPRFDASIFTAGRAFRPSGAG
jgi:[ribosomal protein S5]-alanine N-acetyltransferase